MSLHEILHSELTYRIGWTLIHSLWQGALIAAALAMALVCLREKSPQSRYLAAGLAMACQLLFLVGTFLRLSGSPVPISPTDPIPKPAFSAQVASVSQVKTVQIDSAIAVPSPTWTQSEKDLWQRFSKPLDTVHPLDRLHVVWWISGPFILESWRLDRYSPFENPDHSLCRSSSGWHLSQTSHPHASWAKSAVAAIGYRRIAAGGRSDKTHHYLPHRSVNSVVP